MTTNKAITIPENSIFVSVNKSCTNPTDPKDVKRSAEGEWVHRDGPLLASSRVLFAEKNSVIVGAFHVRGWKRFKRGRLSYVIFDLVPAKEFAHLIGTRSPWERQRGEMRGIKVI
jgi:hypothetical protein